MNFLNEWKECDGYAQNETTAIILLIVSSLCSFVLLQLVERAKLFIFQRSEAEYSRDSSLCSEKQNVLETRSLVKTYNGGVKAVQGVSFDLKKGGEIFGLLGANGAGKSSTFNMVTL